jgi:hypothetical protein
LYYCTTNEISTHRLDSAQQIKDAFAQAARLEAKAPVTQIV